MTDQFKNLKDENKSYTKIDKSDDGLITNKNEFVKEIKVLSDIEKIIAELEALTATSFKDGNLIAHYTFNTAIGIVKKYL